MVYGEYAVTIFLKKPIADNPTAHTIIPVGNITK